MASFRLNKVAKDFNVGIQTIVEYLAKKGHQVEQNPNTKISEEQYELLAAAFQGERKVKEEADKIELMAGGANQVVEASAKETHDSDNEEVIIKSYTAAKPTAPRAPKPAPQQETPLEEKTPVAEPEPQEEPSAVQVEPAEETIPEQPASDSPFNVVGKIDLSALNQRTRPDKKKKAKKGEKKEAPKAAPAPKADDEPKPVKPQPEPEPVKEEIPEPAYETKVEAKTEPEFIETQYQKLEGPKVLDKIDLSQFKKDGADTPGSKRKRKHTKKEAVSAQEVKKIGAEVAKKESKEKEKAKKESQKNAAKQQDGSGKKKKKKEEKKPVEIDENEIEKQIRDTLARLSPLGKSKTSKHNREKRQKVHAQMEEEMLHEMENQHVLQVTEFVTANELATMMNVPVTKIIATCMSVGIFVSINQRLDAETIKLIADEFGFEVNFASEDVVNTLHQIEEEDRPEDLVTRNPIVTVMGHVDHGKTSLLDYIRKTNVIAGEAGGITQHIGAYEVTTAEGRKITFLDTPGHEAFTAMRARGAKMTDIAIIVIAADDKIMPQTIEAINHAQSAGVPIVFAINKIDKPGADPDRIKTELANMNLLVEEWGGKYQSQDISAKKGINVEELLEKVILQADIMELKGNPNKRAKGTVIESTLDKGRGYVPADENKKPGDAIGVIAIDSIHTPIKNVKYEVSDYRVEQRTDYEKLTFDIQTDGSIHPKEALKEAATILIQHFMLFSDERITLEAESKPVQEEFDEGTLHIRQLLKTKLVDMDLSVRALNCLKAAEVETLGDLVSFNKADLLKFRNFGKKSLTELENLVASKNLEFGMNITKYKLDKE